MASAKPSPLPEGSVPRLPTAYELDADAKRRLMAGLRLSLARLQERGHYRADADLDAVIGSPALLADFIGAFRANRALFEDLAVDSKGRPVADDDAALNCGPSLAQVCQMLVYTCARRQFASVSPKTEPVKAAPQGKLASLLGRKPAVAAPPLSEEDLKLRALKPALAFDWQLPLLKSYYFFLDRDHIEALGRDLIALRDEGDIKMIGAIPVVQIAKVRRLVGAGFGRLLADRPAAIRGLASVTRETFHMLQSIIGEDGWRFYDRDQAEIAEVAEVAECNPDRLAAFGPILADASLAAVQAFERIPSDRSAVFLATFDKKFGSDGRVLLGDADFCRRSLKGMVNRFAGFEGSLDDLRGLVELKLAAIAPAVQVYLDKRRPGRSAPGQ